MICKSCHLLPVQASQPVAKRMLKPSHDFCLSCLRRVRERKQAQIDPSAMTIQQQVDLMKRRGDRMSAPLLQRKFGLTFSEALNLL